MPADYAAGTPANLGPSDLVCNGNTGVGGIGRAKAQQIWYRALTVYFNANETYAQAKIDTQKAAEDLYGVGSPEATAVSDTWAAVSMSP